MLNSIKTIVPNIIKRNCKEFVRNIVDSLQYYLGSGRCFFFRPALGEGANIIFVCKGNVCRSAFAEQRLRYLLGDGKVHIDSCGLDVNQGNFPPQDSVTVAAEFSCTLAGRRAKGHAECNIHGADLIVAMEYWQYKRLLMLYPEKKDNIILLRNMIPWPYRLFCNIADPYGWGVKEFRRSYRLIDQSLNTLVHWF